MDVFCEFRFRLHETFKLSLLLMMWKKRAEPFRSIPALSSGLIQCRICTIREVSVPALSFSTATSMFFFLIGIFL